MAPTQSVKVPKVTSKNPKTTPASIQKTAGTRRPRVPRKNRQSKRQDDAHFPFLKLPAELRNIIYEYALVDSENTISIYYEQSQRSHGPQYHRAVKRILMGRSDFHGYNWTEVSKDHRKETESRLDTRLPLKWRLNGRLCAELLLVCKQINTEATLYLYERNYFVFLDTTAMDLFLHKCGQNIRLLRRIGLAYFDMRSSVIHQYSAFRQLINAERLEAFVLGGSCLSSMRRNSSRYYHHSSTSDETFYRVAGSWLWYLAGRKRDTKAALDLLFFKPELYEACEAIQQWQTFCRFDARFGRYIWQLSDEIKSFREAVLARMD